MSYITLLNQSLVRLIQDIGNMELYHTIGCCLYQLKDYKNSESYLKICYEKEPNTKNIIYDYGTVLYAQGKYKEALQVYSSGSTLEINDLKLYERLEELYYRIGEYEQFTRIKEEWAQSENEQHS